jgi:hypothetical protein
MRRLSLALLVLAVVATPAQATGVRTGVSRNGFSDGFSSNFTGAIDMVRTYGGTTAITSSRYADTAGYLQAGMDVLTGYNRSDYTFLQAFKKKFAPYGSRVLVAPYAEPDSSGQSPTSFVAGMKASCKVIGNSMPIVPILTAWTYKTKNPAAYIPNSLLSCIDAIGVDGYFRNYPYPSYGWAGVFDAAVAFAAARGLPLYIGEVGALSRYGNSSSPTMVDPTIQANAIHALEAYVQANPAIQVVLWWEGSTNTDIYRDWRIAWRPIPLQAWTDLTDGL